MHRSTGRDHLLRGVVVLLLASGAIVLGGCGGGDDGPLNISRMGRLTSTDRTNSDGSKGDLVRFTTTRAGWVVVTMESTGADPVRDPYLIVWSGKADDPTGYTLVGSDDDGGTGLNARLAFQVSRGERYTAHFTTYGSGAELGTYRYTIRETQDPYTAAAAAEAEPVEAKPAMDPQAKAQASP